MREGEQSSREQMRPLVCMSLEDMEQMRPLVCMSLEDMEWYCTVRAEVDGQVSTVRVIAFLIAQDCGDVIYLIPVK